MSRRPRRWFVISTPGWLGGPAWRRELSAYHDLGAAQDRVHAAVVRFSEVAAAYAAAAGRDRRQPAWPKIRPIAGRKGR
jgi:hypothetical protein